MRRAKSIIDKDVGIRGQLRGKRWVVLLFACVEAHILQEEELAGAKALHRIFGSASKCITSGRDHHLQVIGESLGRRSEAQSVNHFPVGSPEVGRNDERGAILEERFDRWYRCSNPRVVDDLSVRERHIEVNAQKDARFARVEFANGSLPCGRIDVCRDSPWATTERPLSWGDAYNRRRVRGCSW